MKLGMATGRVRAGFFHTWTRPAGQDLRLGPSSFTNRVFFQGLEPTPVEPHLVIPFQGPI